MNEHRGSEWRRWDLHVHTPLSVLNNHFGDPDTKFDEYVQQLFSKAIEYDIAAIGITDYFSLEGYKKIREYLSNDTKMKELFPEEFNREKIQKILLLPNIEFRIATFVGEKSTAINYHVIFSDKVSDTELEENFLSQLKFLDKSSPGENDSALPLTRNNVEQFGKRLKHEQNFSGTDYKVGLENLVVAHETITSVLKNNSNFINQYLVCIPINDDLSQINWTGRDHNTRKILIQKSHCFFTSNPQNIDWALGKKSTSVAEYVNEFGMLKPCVHASDAHSFDTLFKPDQDRFCWIKADPTYNGLTQILFEPETRVRIQASKPENKPEYNLIDYVKIKNADFSNGDEPAKIYFNPNLNCIIGGKSTGKSLLLNNIAYAIDKKQVSSKHYECHTHNSQNIFSPIEGFEVFWKDQKTEQDSIDFQRKIIYIPQAYIDRLCEKKEEHSYIDDVISDVIFQNSELKNKYEETIYKIGENKKAIENLSHEYHAKLHTLKNIEEKLSENNPSSIVKTEIEKLTAEKDSLSGVKVAPDKINEFNKLCEEDIQNKEFLQELENNQSLLSTDKHIQIELSFNTLTLSSKIQSDLEIFLKELRQTVNLKWKDKQTDLIQKIKAEQVTINAKQVKVQEGLAQIQPLISQNESLKNVLERLNIQNQKFQKSIDLEEKRENTKKALDELLEKIVQHTLQYHKIYSQYANAVNENTEIWVEDLSFNVDIVFKQEEFTNFINNAVNKRSYSHFKEYDLSSVENFTFSNFTPDFIVNLLKSLESDEIASLSFKNNWGFPQSMQTIISDWFNINYDIKMGNDCISAMSPGKKALVILKLLIGLSETECPILLDQPEDDLDNRSIFDDLVQYIKTKKEKRQIIIVSHNANIVIGADAEQVIVANQHGINASNRDNRFEYKCGAIENSYATNDVEFILEKSGIQEHICQILEGGERAFDLRKNKYMFTK